MKKILLIFGLINGILLICGGALFLLAEQPCLRPWEPLFEVQRTAEQWRLALASNQRQQAQFALLLTERRLSDVAVAGDDRQRQMALLAFDQVLGDAVRRLETAPAAVRHELTAFHRAQLDRAALVLANLPPVAAADQPLLLSLIQKIELWQQPNTPPEVIELPPGRPQQVTASAVSFLGQDIDHSLYPLAGKHARLSCEACHPNGQYARTPTDCATCHQAEVARVSMSASYPNHFPGNCDQCHTADNWLPFQFDHSGIGECLPCHQPDTPANHYPDACRLCHQNTTSWQKTVYFHPAVTECRSCHVADSPPNHYLADAAEAPAGPVWQVASRGAAASLPGQALAPGSCINCHPDTSSWQSVTFDHSGFTNCQHCHAADSPAYHYQGQCSGCHSSASWQNAAFNHAGLTLCTDCHDTPPQHYPGGCTLCHTTTAWREIWFSHAGADDCTDCHGNQIPAGHYPARCDSCHNSTSWTFDRFSETSSYATIPKAGRRFVLAMPA